MTVVTWFGYVSAFQSKSRMFHVNLFSARYSSMRQPFSAQKINKNMQLFLNPGRESVVILEELSSSFVMLCYVGRFPHE